MITYSFLLVFLSLILCGHAAPVNTVNNYSSSKFIVKKAHPVAIENKNSDQADCYIINHRTNFPVSHTQFFAVAENNASSLLYYSYRDVVLTRGVEKVLKDHLLHLFPSHYFW